MQFQPSFGPDLAEAGETGAPSPSLRKLNGLVAVVVTTILLCVMLAAALLWELGRTQDRLAARTSEQQLQGLMSLQAQQLAAHVRDYTHWDEAIDALLRRPNVAWWRSNAGDYAVGAFDLSLSLLVDGRGRPRLVAAPAAQGLVHAADASTPSVRVLVDQARALPVDGDAHATVANGLVEVWGTYHQASAVRFRPERADVHHPDPDAVLVFARPLDGALLGDAARVMGLEDLSLTATRPDTHAALPLVLANGLAAGYVSWRAPQPGRELYGAVLPWVLAFSLAVLAAVAYAAVRTRRLTAQIEAGAQTRERLMRRNRSILDAAGDGILGIDRQDRVVFVNQAALRLLGRTDAEVLGCELGALVHWGGEAPALPAREARPWMERLQAQPQWSSDTQTFTDSRGRPLPVEVSMTPVEQGGALEGAVVVFRDISQRRAAQDQIRYRAHYDLLTGAPNRHLLTERLDQDIAHALADGQTLAVMLVDIDQFKKVNDSMGHDAGDRFLQLAHERLQACVPEGALVARLGGDEFAIWLPRGDAAAAVERVAQAILVTLGQRFDLNGHSFWAGGSLGLALCPQDGQSASELLRHAEVAMYKAKEAGRNGYRFFQPDMSRHILESRQLEINLRAAVADQQMLLHFQPIMHVGSGRLSHLEALVRWHDPQRGLIAPDAFIPLAEETGLIVEIGAWVLDESLRLLADWRHHGLDPDVGVAVNISARQVPHGLGVDAIAAALDAHGIPGNRLSFEITESVMFDHSPAITEWLEGVRRLGIHLMIDDFGTGYSSLSYLKQFQAGALKIDKGFIAGVVDTPADQSLVSAMLAMARSLDLAVVAEGVEVPEQMAWLRSNGCDFAQGYWLGRPLAADLVLRWARKNGHA